LNYPPFDFFGVNAKNRTGTAGIGNVGLWLRDSLSRSQANKKHPAGYNPNRCLCDTSMWFLFHMKGRKNFVIMLCFFWKFNVQQRKANMYPVGYAIPRLFLII